MCDVVYTLYRLFSVSEGLRVVYHVAMTRASSLRTILYSVYNAIEYYHVCAV